MAPQRKTLQVRMPAPLYRHAKQVVDEEIEEISSVNEFIVRAIQEKLKRINEAKIDAAFSGMGTDEKYLRTTGQISHEFATSDWQAFKVSEEK